MNDGVLMVEVVGMEEGFYLRGDEYDFRKGGLSSVNPNGSGLCIWIFCLWVKWFRRFGMSLWMTMHGFVVFYGRVELMMCFWEFLKLE